MRGCGDALIGGSDSRCETHGQWFSIISPPPTAKLESSDTMSTSGALAGAYRPLGWTGLATIPIAIALGVVVALGGAFAEVFAVLVVLAVNCAVAWRWPFTNVAVYWLLAAGLLGESFVGIILARVGPYPVTVNDGAVALLLCAVVVTAVRTRNLGTPRALSWVSIGVGIVALWTALAAGIGLANGFGSYSVLIDVRTISYLVVGYLAGRTLLDASRHPVLLVALLLASGVTFVVIQIAQSTASLGSFSAVGMAFENTRDISVPFFMGKYGILAALVMGTSSHRIMKWSSRVLAVGGLVAMGASLVRTGWVTTAAGMGVLFVLGGRRLQLVIGGIVAAVILVAGALVAVAPESSTVLHAVASRAQDALSPTGGPSDTVTIRLNESRAALSALHDPVQWAVGAGLGLSVQDAIHPYQHNSYVWFVSHEGIVGLTLFLATLCFAPVLIGVRALLSHRVGLQSSLLLVLIAAHVANLISGYVSGHLTLFLSVVIFGMTLAWIEQLAENHRALPKIQLLRKQEPKKSSVALVAR